jgi:hypothetical protein
MEALRSSETSVLTQATGRSIPEDGILHSHRRENLKFYIVCIVFSSSKYEGRSTGWVHTGGNNTAANGPVQ